MVTCANARPQLDVASYHGLVIPGGRAPEYLALQPKVSNCGQVVDSRVCGSDPVCSLRAAGARSGLPLRVEPEAHRLHLPRTADPRRCAQGTAGQAMHRIPR